MSTSDRKTLRVAFQGEPGAFSEAAAIQLLGGAITTVPRATYEAAFTARAEGAADAFLAPVENTLAGSVVRVYDLLLQSHLTIVAETILPIEHHLIGCPGATFEGLRSVASHPMALAQCERFFSSHPELKRIPAEDAAGSVREVLARGDKSSAALAGRRDAARRTRPRPYPLPKASKTTRRTFPASCSCRGKGPGLRAPIPTLASFPSP